VRLARAVTVVTALMLLLASNAAADWLFTPFLGGTFAPQIPIVNLEQSAGTTKVVVGGSTALLSDGIFGIEGDFGYSPRFFERSSQSSTRQQRHDLPGKRCRRASLERDARIAATVRGRWHWVDPRRSGWPGGSGTRHRSELLGYDSGRRRDRHVRSERGRYASICGDSRRFMNLKTS
jgi:hypothetical protein